MSTFLRSLALLLIALPTVARGEVLIVADEFPAMEVLAAGLKADEGIVCRIVAQTNMPSSLAPFDAVIVYIHLGLRESAEKAFIEYTQAGGKLIALHHSISSGKRKNKDWFKFLGVDLVPGDVNAGGYKWIEPVTLSFVSLAPDHFIMTNRVKYSEEITYTRSDAAGGGFKRPGFTLKDSEVYINHTLTQPRTLLMGMKYSDAKSGKTWMQDRAGWIQPAGKGWIFYFMPGHSASDFRDPAYARILLNAVLFKP